MSAFLTAIVRWLLSFVVIYEVAVALAYLVGMTIAFILSGLLVFDRSPGSARGQYLRFALVNAVAFPQVWLTSVGLARYVFPWIGFGWNAETVAHLIGMAAPVWSSYLGHKHFSFGSSWGRQPPSVLPEPGDFIR